jgi:hypothetical protein
VSKLNDLYKQKQVEKLLKDIDLNLGTNDGIQNKLRKKLNEDLK